MLIRASWHAKGVISYVLRSSTSFHSSWAPIQTNLQFFIHCYLINSCLWVFSIMCIWWRWKSNVFEIFLSRELNSFLVKTWVWYSCGVMSLKLLLSTRIQWRHERIFVISWLFYKRLRRIWTAWHPHTHVCMNAWVHTVSRISMW